MCYVFRDAADLEEWTRTFGTQRSFGNDPDRN